MHLFIYFYTVRQRVINRALFYLFIHRLVSNKSLKVNGKNIKLKVYLQLKERRKEKREKKSIATFVFVLNEPSVRSSASFSSPFGKQQRVKLFLSIRT